ncbi:hypothetical protein CRM22_003443 [Opisthorchis felineus]|uniref:Uncharacterized protein n=1 Tax=Opisthorchis felineus TaxID=147828 RepID=A0A4S2M170_OPIFE|nr:hypothetical protein CRM22_003443 [Opisthorchis felineus]
MEYKETNSVFRNSDKVMDLYENNDLSSQNLEKAFQAASPQDKPLPACSPLSSRFNQSPKPMHCAKSTESCNYYARDYSTDRISSTVKLEASLNLDTTTDKQATVFERMPQRLLQMDKPSQLSAPMTPVRRKLQRQTATAGQRSFTSSLLSTRGSSGGSFEQQSQERVFQSTRGNKSHPKLFQSSKVMSSAWKYVKRQLSQTELRQSARNK